MRFHNLKTWVSISLVNLMIVACLGVLMRSKIVFDIPFIDYNRIVDTHGTFAFTGWVTLILLSLMVFKMPSIPNHRKIYFYLLSGIALYCWTLLLTGPFEKTHKFSSYAGYFFIVVTYIFAWRFITDILKTNAGKTVKLLVISALSCLVISSVGTIMLSYLFATKSLNAVLYRDALFGYLHFQYNGFFSLSVFAIAFNMLEGKMSEKAKRTVHIFSQLFCLSIIPSLFITFLWHSEKGFLHGVAILGSVLLLATFVWLLLTAKVLWAEMKAIRPLLRTIVFISFTFFAIKLVLQSLTISTTVNILVFGNRPVIMGFLHMVFLGFVTLFVVAYLAYEGFLNIAKPYIRFAITIFTIAVLTNEILLMIQGLGFMLLAGNTMFSWYLWYAGILLQLGVFQLVVSRWLSRNHPA